MRVRSARPGWPSRSELQPPKARASCDLLGRVLLFQVLFHLRTQHRVRVQFRRFRPRSPLIRQRVSRRRPVGRPGHRIAPQLPGDSRGRPVRSRHRSGAVSVPRRASMPLVSAKSRRRWSGSLWRSRASHAWKASADAGELKVALPQRETRSRAWHHLAARGFRLRFRRGAQFTRQVREPAAGHVGG